MIAGGIVFLSSNGLLFGMVKNPFKVDCVGSLSGLTSITSPISSSLNNGEEGASSERVLRFGDVGGVSRRVEGGDEGTSGDSNKSDEEGVSLPRP